MDIVDIVLDSPRIGHEMPELTALRENGLDAFESASQPQHHDISQNVTCAGALSSHHSTPRNASARSSVEPTGPAQPQIKVKDENGQLGGNVGISERATSAHPEFEAGDPPARGTGQPVWVRPLLPDMSLVSHLSFSRQFVPSFLLSRHPR
jgi:hypothetical protein